MSLRMYSASYSCLFFFSSRRRHTRWPRDWSSDVCSSDLACWVRPVQRCPQRCSPPAAMTPVTAMRAATRSEERRVGKECRCRWAREHEKKERREGMGEARGLAEEDGCRQGGGNRLSCVWE